MAYLWFLCTTLVQNVCYQCLKFKVDGFYSLKVMVKKTIKGNKRAMMALDRSPESFSPQLNSTSLFLWFQLVTLRVGPALTPQESYEYD